MADAMRLFQLFKTIKPLDDPIFGQMCWNPAGFWTSEIRFDNQEVIISLGGTKSGPSQAARTQIEEFFRRYPRIKSEIARDLFELYCNYREDVDLDTEPGFPDIKVTNDIWQHTSLVNISMWPSMIKENKLICSYEFDWHDRHDFDVVIQDWQLHGISANG